MTARFHVAGIGNALVDVIAHSDDTFLIENKIEKGAMTLIDTQRAKEIYDRMGQAIEASGGSGANTIAGVASFGGKAAYLGKVADDQLGDVFAHDIRSLGAHFDTPRLSNHEPTGRCLILVTPDAQRSMNTFLGASTQFCVDDLDETLIADAEVLYMEGYLFDPPPAREAFYEAAKMAHRAGRKVSLTLSDSFCVDRYRAEFQHLIETQVDILFANEAELLSLFQVEVFDEAMHLIRGRCDIAVVTRSEQGSVVVTEGDIHIIDAHKAEALVDTTGAGDQYAAGFLFGLTTGKDLVTCGRLGSLAAAEVISHVGPRPEVSLAKLADDLDLL